MSTWKNDIKFQYLHDNITVHFSVNDRQFHIFTIYKFKPILDQCTQLKNVFENIFHPNFFLQSFNEEWKCFVNILSSFFAQLQNAFFLFFLSFFLTFFPSLFCYFLLPPSLSIFLSLSLSVCVLSVQNFLVQVRKR